MDYKTRSNYFKSIAEKNKSIAHGKIELNSNKPNHSFFRINNEEELTAACANWVKFPCLVHAGHNIAFIHNGDELPKKKNYNHLYVLAAINKNNFTFESDAIEDAYDRSYKTLSEIISYMLNEVDVNGSNCNGLFVFNMNNAKVDQVGPYNEKLYGWYLSFYDISRGKEFEYDEEDWSITI